MKKLLSLVVAALMTVAMVGTAFAGKLTVACDTSFPPFEFKDPATGKHTGFDVELWEAIAKKIGADYTLQPMDFNGIIPGLQSNQVDVGIAGITIKPERAKVVDFSDGYYNSGLLILVKKDDNSVNDIKDLKGKIIATKLNTTSAEFAKKAGAKEVKLYPNSDAMFMELMAGGADAVIFDSPVIADFMRKAGKGQVKVVGPLYNGQQYGIAFPKGSKLVAKVNAALKELRKSGEYRELYIKWFGTEPK
ncbi:glutamine ABC transporter substrate-binding protein GlnH [Maridesulfovibrio hydrothermalis]|uniref:ABC transporter glutamine-binding protein glnH n=1 Tax=Maridesulfovibrio hydrothermalis AM13 = DSM 14728 TaxID=1121451 RepID=L0RDE1_9BACT|nr:glutamine ABC transporter substrate-binding protein GlnH [Maridesulfovibrio hydrothermalis]CCO24220.1 ABC transporter glutamine-binding protein glnH [Maridesulfovibrio hydrothermalis AM13 = DSM 14728]